MHQSGVRPSVCLSVCSISHIRTLLYADVQQQQQSNDAIRQDNRTGADATHTHSYSLTRGQHRVKRPALVSDRDCTTAEYTENAR